MSWWIVTAAGNAIVSVAYLMIAVLIGRGLHRSELGAHLIVHARPEADGRSGTDPDLATAVAATSVLTALYRAAEERVPADP